MNNKPDRVGVILAIVAIILIVGVPIVVALLTGFRFGTPERPQITGGPVAVTYDDASTSAVAVEQALTGTAIAQQQPSATPVPQLVNPSVVAMLLTATDLPVFDEPTRTRAVSTPSPAITGTPPTRAPCYFNWATQDLPELTAEVQAAMAEAGLENVTASAFAYGENCYALDTNEVVYFAIMETDFRVTAQVDDLMDAAALGNLTADILSVLNEFPPGDTPGPQPGQITLTFVNGDEQKMLLVSVEVAAQVVEQGIRGAGLWVTLNELR